MKPMYTLLLCLPAALALIACGVALLWPPTTLLAEHPTVGRRQGRSSAAGGSKAGWGTIQTLGRSRNALQDFQTLKKPMYDRTRGQPMNHVKQHHSLGRRSL